MAYSGTEKQFSIQYRNKLNLVTFILQTTSSIESMELFLKLLYTGKAKLPNHLIEDFKALVSCINVDYLKLTFQEVELFKQFISM